VVGTRELIFDFDDEVKLGLSASNFSSKPFEATFENFVLLDDRAMIDAEFGDFISK
jgi:hypothetical protein